METTGNGSSNNVTPVLVKKVNQSFGSDAQALTNTLSIQQRQMLLLRYAETTETNQNELDQLLQKFIKLDHQLLLKFMSEVELTSQGAFGRLLNSKAVDQKIANHAMMLEYKKFWFDEATRQVPTDSSSSEKYNKVENEETMQSLKKLASYVPKLVVRRFYNNPNPVSPPEIESYQACVVFADISGFTPLTEKMAALGPEGVEKLTKHLNKYFDMMISNIYRHGGDIVKFAGDAVLVIWPASNKEGLNNMISLACQCARSLIDELNDYEVEGTGCMLRLHIGIGAGPAGGVHVGGTQKQFEFFISGNVLEQVSSCEKQALPGEVYVSAVAWMLLKKGTLAGQQKGGGALANYRLEGIKVPLELPPPLSIPLFKYMEESLKTYIQPGVVRHIYSGTKRFLAELRTVSVIFVNLTSPFVESKLQELQSCISAMQETVYKYEGTVRQFMIDDKGSVLIAGFGLPPFSHEDDANRAVEAALEIYAKLEEMKIACSIGVTTGKAFCGDVGTDQRREYAMVGDIVNLSARLMAAAKKGILTDNDTYEAAKTWGSVAFEKQDPIKVKGKANLIPVFIPSKKKRTDTKKTEKTSFTKTIIGREEEVVLIQRSVKKLLELSANNKGNNMSSMSRRKFQSEVSSGRVLVIEGEAGVGKSRLVHEAQTIFKGSGNIFIGHGEQLKITTSYHAWVPVLEGLASNDQKGELRKNIKMDVELMPLLSNILPVKVPENSRTQGMSAQMRSELTQTLLFQLIQGLAPRGSVIILEDAQWLDSNSWALALAVHQQVEGVLLIVALRSMKDKGRVPFHYSQLLHSQHTETISLQNLTESETAQLVAQCLHMPKIPDDMSREIYKKSQGNPYLTEEIVYALRDSGALQINKNGQVTLTSDIQTSIPSNLNGLITSKVDKMSPSQQVLLKVASTIGSDFSSNMIQAVLMAQGTETSKMMMRLEDIKKDFKAIENLSLIVGTGSEPNITYNFVNTLIKDVVYGLMLFSLRRQIHSNVGSYYLEVFPGNTNYYPILAYHFKQAEMDNEALEYYTKAGSSCLNAYENKEAVTFFTEALQVMKKLREKPNIDDITMERKLGQAYYNLGQFDKAMIQFKKALEILGLPISEDDISKKSSNSLRKKMGTLSIDKEKRKSQQPDPSEKALKIREAVISLLALTKVCFNLCNKGTAVVCANLALQASSTTGTALEGEANAISCLTAGMMGDHQNAELYIQKGRELAGKHVDVSKVVEQMAGIYYCGVAQWSKAQEALKNAITAAQTVGDLRTYEECLLHLGTVHFFKGDLKQSIQTTEEALDSSIRRGDAQSQVTATTVQARNFYAMGNYAKCLSCLEEIKVGLDSIGQSDVSTEVNYCALAALIFLRQKKLDLFWFFSEATFALLSKTEPTMYSTCFGYVWLLESYIRIILNTNYLEDGKIPLNKSKLVTKVEKSLSFLTKFSETFVSAGPSRDLWKGVTLWVNGKQTKAKQIWAKALEGAKNFGMAYEEALIIHRSGLVSKNEEDVKKSCQMYPELQYLTTDISGIKGTIGDNSMVTFRGSATPVKEKPF